MSYRWVEHTAEVQVEIEARTEEAVFGDALQALGELLADDADGEQVWREVAVDGQDPRRCSTYHRLAFERTQDGFRARVVLDV